MTGGQVTAMVARVAVGMIVEGWSRFTYTYKYTYTYTHKYYY